MRNSNFENPGGVSLFQQVRNGLRTKFKRNLCRVLCCCSKFQKIWSGLGTSKRRTLSLFTMLREISNWFSFFYTRCKIILTITISARSSVTIMTSTYITPRSVDTLCIAATGIQSARTFIPICREKVSEREVKMMMNRVPRHVRVPL